MSSDNDEFIEVDNSDSAEAKKAPILSQTSNWMSWGTSIMQTASNLTQNLSQTINTALETGIGAPNPEQLVEIDKLSDPHNESKQFNESQSDETTKTERPTEDDSGLSGLIAGFGQITKLVESTGSKVITGGLDTLETIGKKTMEVIETPQRFLMSEQKINLSEVLKETAAVNSDPEFDFSPKIDFEHLFDDYQGLVHFEALEMLSKQCDIKLEEVYESYEKDSNELNELKQTMDQVTELCEISSTFGDNDDDRDEEQKMNWDTIEANLKTIMDENQIDIDLQTISDKFSKMQSNVFCNDKFDWLLKDDVVKSYVDYLAQITSILIECYHKTGETLLVTEKRSTANEADGLVQLTINFMAIIQLMTRLYVEHLSDDESNKTIITNMYLDASNSQFHIKQAFQLLIPVIKLGAI